MWLKKAADQGDEVSGRTERFYLSGFTNLLLLCFLLVMWTRDVLPGRSQFLMHGLGIEHGRLTRATLFAGRQARTRQAAVARPAGGVRRVTSDHV
jgi:hypothetical protein